MNNTLLSAWDGNPPTILAISQPMPNAPYLPLSGGCTTRMSLENFLKDVERDFQQQQVVIMPMYLERIEMRQIHILYKHGKFVIQIVDVMKEL